MLSSFLTLITPASIGSHVLLILLTYLLSIAIYRLYFHPLARFPGPILAVTSRLYEFYYDAICHGRLWTKLPDLHKRYGGFPVTRLRLKTHK